MNDVLSRMGEAVADLARIADRLRAPDGCPWDREQTHASLRPNLLEEAYEALEALDADDHAKLRDELGDLLFQVVIHSQLAREDGEFDLGEVARRMADKLVRRHPHVFEGKAIDGDVLSQWERIKRTERDEAAALQRRPSSSEMSRGEADEMGQEKPSGERGSILDGIPVSLPALFRAERLQERVERIGVEVPTIDLPIDIDDERFLGDLLFDLVAAARELGYDAETALRAANGRFAAHVARMEERARAEGRELGSYDPDDVRRLWETTA